MNTPAHTVAPVASDRLWLYALLALVATAGFFYVNIMAAIVDGLVTGLGFSNPQAGMVGAANIYGASVGSFIAVLLVRRIAWRPALFTLLALLLLIDLSSTVLRDPAVLTAVRALHGLVGGMAVGVTYAVMARTRSPDRAFGMLLLVQFGLGGLGVMFLPTLVPDYGARILFLSLAALTTVALAALATIPRFDGARQADGAAVTRLLPPMRATAAMVLLALFLFQGGNMALGAFIIRLGEHFHLDRDFIGQALGWATWIGAAGAGLVIFMGARFGRLRPLLVALLLTLAGTAGFFWSGSQPLFFIANIGTAITWSFVVPYLFGMLSRLDTSGRLATLGGFVSKLGLASGPMLAGRLLANDDFPLLIAVAIVALVASGVAMLAAAHRIDRLEPNA
ncbi:putative MFS family arabinose efflux permease [Pseudoxanthomonas sp. 3HH-4]|uniref:MFS transporter n=1 Tax=Pseudoxanthomonas sp. 3HH-4 TaxID=1690214 RepID=UPI001153337E|nr:MFS transporter [Pseudoxanthomonas sp. 3HH-4]TQM03702.1 putative MFS family arabinose efflux permease [Pseudoxanthomonas sp. 3HH-4]